MLVNGQESLVAQKLERPTGIWEAMGSIPVRNSDFLFVHDRDKWTYHLYQACCCCWYPAIYVGYQNASEGESTQIFSCKIFFVDNFLNNKTIYILLSLVEYRLILANSTYGQSVDNFTRILIIAIYIMCINYSTVIKIFLFVCFFVLLFLLL